MSDELPICDWFLDRLATLFEQFVDWHPVDARNQQLSRVLFRGVTTDPEFERGLAGIASTQGQHVANDLRSRIISFIQAIETWERMKEEDEHAIQEHYWLELYEPGDKLAAHLRNLSFIEQRKHTPDNTKATQIELRRRIEELKRLPANLAAGLEKLKKDRWPELFHRCCAFAGRRLELAVDLRAFKDDEKTRQLRRSNYVASDVFLFWMTEQLGKLIKAKDESEEAFEKRKHTRFEQGVARLVAILTAKVDATEGQPNAPAVGKKPPGTDPGEAVRSYIQGRRAAGIPIMNITRDGIVNGLKAQGVSVSGGKVSQTTAWKALLQEKQQAKAKHVPRSLLVSSNVEEAIERGDWDHVQKAQENEEQARRRKRK